MKKLSQVILELLAISLGVDQLHYKKFFEDAETMMRCNSYPPCSGINVGTLGTGPHCDPTSVTISGDQVGGLEAFVDNKWLAIRPQPNTFVINIGDTFKALTNGIY
ncbi:gibberellin-44 dioxygenase [Trifolium repens]|nr:gibberellin 20 oxidase [Trifolium repens]WJX53738.1 gibberellin-44 dioxygenase [Trifolium repens]